MKALVTFVKRFDFTNDRGERVSGTTIVYQRPMTDQPDMRGMIEKSITATYETFNQFTKVPGYYDLEVDSIPVGRNKEKDIFSSARLIKEFKFEP